MTDMTQRLAALPADRRARFLTRLREQAEAAGRRGPASRGDTGPVPLSPAQETLRFLDPPAPDGPVAGMPLCLHLRGGLDAHALRSALAAVVARHDALRTVIVEREGAPMQVVVPEVPVGLPLTEAEGDDHEQRLAAARALVERRSRAPFDLTRTPVWRAVLIRVAPDEHLFLLDVPEIVCDAWSRNVLVRELAECYRSLRDGDAPRLPDLPVHYPDYAAWQRGRLRGDDLDRLAAYWRQKLAGVEVLEFPTDRPRGDTRTFAGDRDSFPVGHEGVDRARELARQEGASPFDVLLAAFFTLLHRYSGLDDLVIGSPDANRRHDAVSSVLGLFIDMRGAARRRLRRPDLPRVGPAGRARVVGRVRAWRPALRQAGRRGATRPSTPSRSPVFQIVFGAGRTRAPRPACPVIVTSRGGRPAGTTRFDMSWSLASRPLPAPTRRCASSSTPTCSTRESIARFARHYDGLLRTLTADPDAPLSAAEVLSPADKEFLAEVSHGPTRPIRETTVVEQFEARVREAPDSVAVVVTGVETGYAELNARANRLAALLREHGVEPGTTDRTLPAQERGPADRDPRGAQDRRGLRAARPGASARAGRGDRRRCGPARGDRTRRRRHDRERGRRARRDPRRRPRGTGGDAGRDPTARGEARPTSRTSSTPPAAPASRRACCVEHRGVVNFIDSTRDLFDLTPADRVLGFASVTFDVSVFETFSALLTGARLCLVTDDERLVHRPAPDADGTGRHHRHRPASDRDAAAGTGEVHRPADRVRRRRGVQR